jgi:hypothetical protein
MKRLYQSDLPAGLAQMQNPALKAGFYINRYAAIRPSC